VPSVPLTPGQPSLAAALGPFCENSRGVFRCPLDDARYPVEGLSYEYQPRVAGKTLEQLRANKLGLPLTEIWLTYDFDPVHGPDPNHSRNYLYADGHVE
jgi:prepilin-type processing-associated H-X9-DG protein